MSTILVVDDHPTARQLIVTLLSYQGHSVLESCGGREALEIVEQIHPDLVITDLNMPDMHGTELVRILRERESSVTAKTPILFYTASICESEMASLVSSTGAVDVLSKPCDPQLILAAVERAIGPPPSPAKVVKPVSDDLSFRLSALIEVIQQTAAEQDVRRLLRVFCHATRRIIGASYAVICMLDEDGASLRHVESSDL